MQIYNNEQEQLQYEIQTDIYNFFNTNYYLIDNIRKDWAKIGNLKRIRKWDSNEKIVILYGPIDEEKTIGQAYISDVGKYIIRLALPTEDNFLLYKKHVLNEKLYYIKLLFHEISHIFQYSCYKTKNASYNNVLNFYRYSTYGRAKPEVHAKKWEKKLFEMYLKQNNITELGIRYD